ncbi:MAG: LOG family protein, partial [Candidatus Omnitrophota bacterium]
GPSMMDAPLRGYIEAREEARARAEDGSAISRKTQGIRITLPFEQKTTEYAEEVYVFKHFVTRKLGLNENCLGTVVFPGGFGTIDELFEVWLRGEPVVLIGRSYWQPIMDALLSAWSAENLMEKNPSPPHITNSLDDAMEYLERNRRKILKSDLAAVRVANREIARNLKALSAWEPSVTIMGEPADGSPALFAAKGIMSGLSGKGIPVRAGSRGKLLDTLIDYSHETGTEDTLQASLLVSAGRPLADKEKQVKNLIVSQDMSNHHVTVTENSRAFVFLPGGIKTMNRLFDVVGMMATRKMPRRPVILVGRNFWQPLKNAIVEAALSYSPGLISVGDEDIVSVVDTADEAMELLGVKPAGPVEREEKAEGEALMDMSFGVADCYTDSVRRDTMAKLARRIHSAIKKEIMDRAPEVLLFSFVNDILGDLIPNAVDAVFERVDMGGIDKETASIRFRLFLLDNAGRFRLELSDQGVGIDPGIMEGWERGAFVSTKLLKPYGAFLGRGGVGVSRVLSNASGIPQMTIIVESGQAGKEGMRFMQRGDGKRLVSRNGMNETGTRITLEGLFRERASLTGTLREKIRTALALLAGAADARAMSVREENPKTLVLYADEVLRSMVISDKYSDFGPVLQRLTGEGGVLKGGNVILYTDNYDTDTNCRAAVEGLERYIANLTGKVKVTIVCRRDIYGDMPVPEDAVEQVDGLVKGLACRSAVNSITGQNIRAEDILCVIRGNGHSVMGYFGGRNYRNARVPLVILNTNAPGIFSLAEALAFALHASEKTGLVRILQPLDVPEHMREEYKRYVREVLTKA